nr:reverse transcriptase domain-containing protein [Tanacetum cinerariifolium]
MSTRSTSYNLFSPLKDPESLIRRRNFGEPSSLFDFKEVMSIHHNNQGSPPAGPPPQNNNGPPPVIDTFYNGLTLRHRDTINAAAGGTFMKKKPEECYDLIKNMTAHHNHWDNLATQDETSRTISFTTTTESPEVVRQLEMINKNFQDMMKHIQSVKSVNSKCETCGGPHSFTEYPAVGGYTQKITTMRTEMKNDFETSMAKQNNDLKNMMSSFIQMNSSLGLGSLPSNTIPNLRGEIKAITTQSGIILNRPSVPSHPPFSSPKEVKHEPEPIMDQVPTESTIRVPPPVVQSPPTPISFELPKRNPHQPPIPYPSRDTLFKDGSCFSRCTRRRALRDGDEKLIFHANNSSKHPHKHGNESINMINFIDITCEDCFPKVLKFKKSSHPFSGSTTPLSDSFSSLTPFETSDSLLEEFINELVLLDLFPPGNEDDNFDPNADLREIEYLLNQYPSTEFDIEIIDPIFKRFIDEPDLDYSPPPGDDDDDLFDLNFDNEEWKKLLYGDSYNDTHSKNNIT